MQETQPSNGFLDLQLGNLLFFSRTSKVLLPSQFWGNGMVGNKDWLSSPRDALPAKAPPEASRLFIKKVTVDLQVDEIYELSRRRDVVWATFSFRFDNQPGVRLLSARPKALGCLVCSERDGE